jgi:hypothetical protein
MAEDRLAAEIVTQLHEAERARADWEDIWIRAYQLYRSFVEELDEEDADRANLFIPRTWAQVETIVPRVVATMLARRPWVEVRGVEPGDEEAAYLNAWLIDHQFERQTMFLTLLDLVREAVIAGTAIGHLSWRYEARRMRRRVWRPIVSETGVDLTRLLGAPMTPQEIEQERIVWDEPYLYHDHLLDHYPSPEGKDIDEIPWIIRRSWVSLDDLVAANRAMEALGVGPVYQRLGELEQTAPPEEDLAQEEIRSAIGMSGVVPIQGRRRTIELLARWENDRLVVVANRTVTIRDAESVFWHGRKPFVRLQAYRIPHEYYGVGIPEVIQYLQEEVNARHNQRLDAATLALNPLAVISRGAGVRARDLVMRPGGILWVDALDDVNKLVQFIRGPEIPASAYQEEAALNQEMDAATGASEFARGEFPEQRPTATEVGALVNAISSRVDLMVRVMAYTGLREVGRHFLWLNQQFMTQPKAVRILGARGVEWRQIAPWEIAGEFDVLPAAANVDQITNPLQQRKDALEILEIGGGEQRSPEFQAHPCAAGADW